MCAWLEFSILRIMVWRGSHCLNASPCMQSPDDGQLGRVQFFTSTNDAAINILVCVSWDPCIRRSRGKACSFPPGLILPGALQPLVLGDSQLRGQGLLTCFRQFVLLRTYQRPAQTYSHLSACHILTLLPPPRAPNPRLLPGLAEAQAPPGNSLGQCWSLWYHLR